MGKSFLIPTLADEMVSARRDPLPPLEQIFCLSATAAHVASLLLSPPIHNQLDIDFFLTKF